MITPGKCGDDDRRPDEEEVGGRVEEGRKGEMREGKTESGGAGAGGCLKRHHRSLTRGAVAAHHAQLHAADVPRGGRALRKVGRGPPAARRRGAGVCRGHETDGRGHGEVGGGGAGGGEVEGAVGVHLDGRRALLERGRLLARLAVERRRDGDDGRVEGGGRLQVGVALAVGEGALLGVGEEGGGRRAHRRRLRGVLQLLQLGLPLAGVTAKEGRKRRLVARSFSRTATSGSAAVSGDERHYYGVSLGWSIALENGRRPLRHHVQKLDRVTN